MSTAPRPCAVALGELCVALSGGSRSFTPTPAPAPLQKAALTPEFLLLLDGHYYLIDMATPAALFMMVGSATWSVRGGLMTNCRRSDGQAQVIDPEWYFFYGTTFSIVYQVQSISYQPPRSAAGRAVLDIRTSHGLMICDGEVTPLASPDDWIFKDGLETPAGAATR